MEKVFDKMRMNPNINYCPKCGNVLWTKSFVDRRLF